MSRGPGLGEVEKGEFLYTKTRAILTLPICAAGRRRHGAHRAWWTAAGEGPKEGGDFGIRKRRGARLCVPPAPQGTVCGPLSRVTQGNGAAICCCIPKLRFARSVNSAPKGGPRRRGPRSAERLGVVGWTGSAPFRRIVRGTMRVPWSVDATAERASRRVSGGAKHPALGVAAG